MPKPTLSESLEAASRFFWTFNEGDPIDEESGFDADHLGVLIEWASTCSDATPPGD